MKYSILYKLPLVLVTILFVNSCVKPNDFEAPDMGISEINIEGTEITINALRELLIQEQNNNENNFLSFSATDQFISGYVISNDEAGNFFKELILQDATSSPTTGVKILLDVNPLFISYEFGRKIYVKLDGLTVGFDSGVLTLGIRDGGSVEKISESQMDEIIIRDSVVSNIIPLPITREEFSSEKTNLYVQLKNVQFRIDEVIGEDHKTFAAEPTDEFDGERRLVFCSNRRSVIFSTSTFADFKALLLPDGRGTMDGILTYNFFGEDFNMVVNDPTTIYFDNDDRCDPLYLDCGMADEQGVNIVFGDDFESQENNDPIVGNGWTNLSQEGTRLWEGFDGTSGNPPFGKISAQIGSFNSGDKSTITWLITPLIEFDQLVNGTLTFLTSTSFADDSILEVLVSTNWDGSTEDIDSFEWANLSAARIANSTDPFQDYIPSGVIDLSCIEGVGHLAWRYTGSGDPDFDGTYELDEIEIRSN
jgi:Family of unknown function (DUF5689)